MLFIDYVLLGIGGLFFFSLVAVLLVSWIMGRGTSHTRRRGRPRDYEEDILSPPPAKKSRPQSPPSSQSPSSGVQTGMENSLVEEIMNAEVPDPGILKGESQGTAPSSSGDRAGEQDDPLGGLGEDFDELSDIEDFSEEKEEGLELEEDFLDEGQEEEDEEIEEFSRPEAVSQEVESEGVPQTQAEVQETEDEAPMAEEAEEDEGDLAFLYEGEEDEMEVSEGKEEELPSSRPDCFGDPEVFHRCSKSCGVGEECREKILG